ncbi:unnamed protein product, partial [Durusdinium trenchii]
VLAENEDHWEGEDVEDAERAAYEEELNRQLEELQGADEEVREDYWEIRDEGYLIRHHVQPRFEFFYPEQALMELRVDL